jgi:hypothetical protein
VVLLELQALAPQRLSPPRQRRRSIPMEVVPASSAEMELHMENQLEGLEPQSVEAMSSVALAAGVAHCLAAEGHGGAKKGAAEISVAMEIPSQAPLHCRWNLKDPC